MNLPKVVANFKTTLSDELAVAGSSFDIDSVATSHGDLADDIYAIVIDEGTEDEEHIIGELTDNTFSSLIRDVSVQDGETSQSTGKKHRRGAQVKITNFALVQIARALRGDMALAGDSPMRYASAHTFSNDRDLVDKAFVIATATGGVISFDRQILEAIDAGETVAENDLLYFKEADQEWYKADDDTLATINDVKLAIALGDGTDGNEIQNGVLLLGRKSGFSGLDAGARYYSSTTAGGMSTTKGANSVFLGWALTDSVFLFAPREGDILNGNDVTRARQIARTGEVKMMMGSTEPTGWLIMNGQEVSRTTYADLFAYFNTEFGSGTFFGAGNGTTTFNLPDMRGRAPIGFGAGAAIAITFVDANVNTGSEEITVASNDVLHTGQKVTLSTSGVLPTGLSAGDYYVIRVSATAIKLATSQANAIAGTAVNITAAAGGGTHTLTVAALSSKAIGTKGGQEFVTAVPSHKHTTNAVTSPNSGGGGGSSSAPNTTAVVDAAGIETANNYSPYLAVNFLIKT